MLLLDLNLQASLNSMCSMVLNFSHFFQSISKTEYFGKNCFLFINKKDAVTDLSSWLHKLTPYALACIQYTDYCHS